MRSYVIFVLALALTATITYGGQSTGDLKVVVRDVNGAVVPGAKVIIQSLQSDIKDFGRGTSTRAPELVTDSKGEFSSPLENGTYDVFISHPALLPIAKRTKIVAKKVTSLDFVLKLDPHTHLIE